ncbi:hypothetical protein E1193_00215 [Micromonospora sp. KC606]|uniref:hypothetical protein n=1 Tax=Micromonospora sp. KC606 TaxID=2530379 RepID=UPI0010E39C6D|nr:hypothetical protein [Micromonospora sp. KC606]TDC86132.1 hypothetical protein E1193_00215 [Micromonospora sp. KC606]
MELLPACDLATSFVVHPEDPDVPDVTPHAGFACPALTTFCRLDELVLEAVGQRLECRQQSWYTKPASSDPVVDWTRDTLRSTREIARNRPGGPRGYVVDGAAWSPLQSNSAPVRDAGVGIVVGLTRANR